MNRSQSWTCHAAALSAFLRFGATARAATWAEGRTTPSLREIVAVDATGETGWPYGSEDVAGDGRGAFTEQEQSIDIRTAYAATDAQRLWVRAYVSSSQAPGASVRAFVFVDADRDPSTGGTAAAPEIDANLTDDPSPGGYEHVLRIAGDGSAVELWNHQGNQYVNGNLPAGRAAGEADTDADPIRIGPATRGYVQASIELGDVELTRACDGNLYFRTVNDTASLGTGDLDVGRIGACIPDADENGVPDLVVPRGECASDAECPALGICQAGRCLLARPCAADADCGADMQCTADGRCVPAPRGNCTTTAECDGLVCQGRRCVACTASGNQCGAGSVCAPDGRCVTDQGPGGGADGGGLQLAPGESVKGGACHCELSGQPRGSGAPAWCAWAWGLGALAVARRRSARRR